MHKWGRHDRKTSATNFTSPSLHFGHYPYGNPIQLSGFSLSLLCDLIPKLDTLIGENLIYFFEDGFNFLGIVSWCLYCVFVVILRFSSCAKNQLLEDRIINYGHTQPHSLSLILGARVADYWAY